MYDNRNSKENIHCVVFYGLYMVPDILKQKAPNTQSQILYFKLLNFSNGIL